MNGMMAFNNGIAFISDYSFPKLPIFIHCADNCIGFPLEAHGIFCFRHPLPAIRTAAALADIACFYYPITAGGLCQDGAAAFSYAEKTKTSDTNVSEVLAR